MHWYRWDGTDLVLQVQIQPRASRDELAGVVGDYLKIRITAAPVEGKANAHLMAFVAKQFGTTKGQVSLLHGRTAKTKVLRVHAPRRIPPSLDVLAPNGEIPAR